MHGFLRATVECRLFRFRQSRKTNELIGVQEAVPQFVRDEETCARAASFQSIVRPSGRQYLKLVSVGVVLRIAFRVFNGDHIAPQREALSISAHYCDVIEPFEQPHGVNGLSQGDLELFASIDANALDFAVASATVCGNP